jgi:hypothetical protein
LVIAARIVITGAAASDDCECVVDEDACRAPTTCIDAAVFAFLAHNEAQYVTGVHLKDASDRRTGAAIRGEVRTAPACGAPACQPNFSDPGRNRPAARQSARGELDRFSLRGTSPDGCGEQRCELQTPSDQGQCAPFFSRIFVLNVLSGSLYLSPQPRVTFARCHQSLKARRRPSMSKS